VRATLDPPDGIDRVRLALVGFGRVGRAVLELALSRPWIEVVAVVAKRPERDGEACAATVPSAPAGLVIRVDTESVLRSARPDVVIVATTSRLVDVHPQLVDAARSGARAVVSTAEELAWVRPGDGPSARAIHGLASRHDVAIVATGVNPGFALDLFPLVLTALAWDVERIEARRNVDVSAFAPHTRRQLGIGHDADSFATGVASGSIVGHLGFRESLRLLGETLGRPAERIDIETRPIFADRTYVLEDGVVEHGTTIGARQRAVAWREGRPWIDVEMLLHAAPAEAGLRTVDEARVFGRHELHASLDPGSPAIPSTAAQLVNVIPTALRAAPGWYGPGMLPAHGPWLGREMPATLASGYPGDRRT
jgi:4-hydroxy-tetrahydrodipicolinate reductase